jgi:hypothetical protein
VYHRPTGRQRMGGVPDKSESLSAHQVTRLLQAWGSGDEGVLEQLMPLCMKSSIGLLSGT